MTKLEQMQEKALNILHQAIPHTPIKLHETNQTEYDKGYIFMQDLVVRHVLDSEQDIKDLITEVRNEAIKECEGCVAELERWEATDGGEAGMRAEDNGDYIDRNQTLQAISKLRI